MGRNWGEATKILVVEDDPLTAKLLYARLAMEGLQIMQARNGLEGLAMYMSYGADLISTDLMMPGMDGYRMLREIRALPGALGRVPVLVLSVNRSEEDMVRCLAAGADDYMTKPLSPQVYVEKLWRLFARATA